MDEKKRMLELVTLLNKARKAYYQDADEIMSNYDYDALSDELLALEKKTGIMLSDSPSNQVGYEAVSELLKERHKAPMLSLNKTKSVEELSSFLGDKEGLLSWKMDGITIVLTYNNGELEKAVTRGNGEVGEVVTNNAKVFCNVPLKIPFVGELTLRGEAVISYSDFKEINASLPEGQEKYKNPRNLTSGSVRQLNNKITGERRVHFFAFALVDAGGIDFENEREKQLLWLKSQGFDIVEYERVNSDTLERSVNTFEDKIAGNDYPSDGLVLIFNDIAYGNSLGRTAKFPRDGIAFKWADETGSTKLLKVEWSPSRTGLINPIAVFEPVELEGTTVTRASVHNVSIVKDLALGIGDEIEVYKANMIIPQIARNLTRSGNLEIPKSCPVCGGETIVRREIDTEALYCTNPDCQAKHLKAFSLFVSRDALNVDGLSDATLEKFIGNGWIHEFSDIFRLGRYADDIKSIEGFGEKSCNNLLNNIEKARNTTLAKALYSIGVPGIGLSNAKTICKELGNDPNELIGASEDRLSMIGGIGRVLAKAFTDYFADEKKKAAFIRLLDELNIASETGDESDELSGLTFVITGSLKHFENRSVLKEFIESKGAKTADSVSKNTNYLINNDVTSTSGKNKKAKELGVKIISEDEFIKMTDVKQI
ncbi:MAG: NAD-dependent DNA ligase LigA [Lachnospiraceae bacterium]|jgi:DNA ligase (NAD+)|nr:NAD-dependent DNA ligase LigA [Lachnospiraceae bacterium]